MGILVVQGQLSLVTMLCILTKSWVLCNKCCVMFTRRSIWDVFRLTCEPPLLVGVFAMGLTGICRIGQD